MSNDIRKEVEEGDLNIYNDYLDALRLLNIGIESNIPYCKQIGILNLWSKTKRHRNRLYEASDWLQQEMDCEVKIKG
jgi:hypothetical protein